MQRFKKNILDQKGFLVIPTNLMTKSNGEAVMGAGLAKQAANWFAERNKARDRAYNLPLLYGRHLLSLDATTSPADLFHAFPLILLPTKRDWRLPADFPLIQAGLKSLRSFVIDEADGLPVYIPRIGCGLGGLDWENTVLPEIEKILGDFDTVFVST